ncbi:MAG TPA: Na+/H+ antiporter NhaA [Tepidisphaeraceae bacterium]|jgi:NhaA family Na+:H+ antiporter|nr:Na+/H+ antiporter NhaA [Tepidisphaeraceae bacterium]
MEAPQSPIVKSKLAPLLRPIDRFLSAESAGGILLIIGAIVALFWANSQWGDGYQHFWHTKLAITFGDYKHALSLEHWVNDGLMVIFFLLVGLEIKRELVIGELASIRSATLPLVAAIGGMVVPAGLYLAFNAGGEGSHGWGVPMATDIAFAIGVLALVGKSVSTSVKIFLLAVAIVDDLGAVMVIAFFYTGDINTGALGVAGGFLAALVALNLLRVHRPLPYILLGLGMWAATLYSGIHATIAGVLLAFTIPATRQTEERPYVDYVRQHLATFEREVDTAPDVITDDQSHSLLAMEEASQAVQTPLARVEHALLRPVNFIIVPLFALANAGVDLRSGGTAAFGSPVMWGILVGLFVGKPLGVLVASWIAIKMGIASMPTGGTVRHLTGVAVLCGIGFTMSLLVANLAFPASAERLTAAKVGILAASVLAAVVGGLLLATSGKRGQGVVDMDQLTGRPRAGV